MTAVDSLTRNEQLDTWIAVESDGTVAVRTGKVELGQGLRAAIARIAAEELELALDRVRVEAGDTDTAPEEGITAGSMSMMYSGTAVRRAAAAARAHLLELAATSLEADADELRVEEDGTVTHPGSGRSTTYWELLGGRRFDRLLHGDVEPLPPERHRIVGRPGPRPDLEAIVTGTTQFVHDFAPPGMLHGRVLRPPTPGARLESLEEPDGVTIVRDGSFVGVLAEREEDAVAALESLRARARWSAGDAPQLPQDVTRWLREQPTLDFPVVDGVALDAPVEPYVPLDAPTRIEASYSRPFQLHGSIGPAAALAAWEDGRLTVWSHAQGPLPLRDSLAEVLALDRDDVHVIHTLGAGCYGHNGADDAALDAALLARAAGRPVLLKWTREDEHLWEPCGPPAVVEVSAGVDGDGRIADWNLEAWGLTHDGRPYGPGCAGRLLSAQLLAEPTPAPRPLPALEPEMGIHRNATPIYDLPRRRIVKHFVEPHPRRTSSTRALGSYVNVFAIESAMDELAEAAGADPLDFRLRHLSDERAADVLRAAADAAGWTSRIEEYGRGKGIGLARYKNRMAYAAVVADVSVDDETALVRVERLVVAADAGEIVDPDGLANQLEGGAVQSTSWTLKEEVRIGPDGVESRDWETYPILTFPETPEVETVLIDRPGSPFLGAGEATQGPTAGAIANAVFAAVGLRLREIPFTPARLRAAAGL